MRPRSGSRTTMPRPVRSSMTARSSAGARSRSEAWPFPDGAPFPRARAPCWRAVRTSSRSRCTRTRTSGNAAVASSSVQIRTRRTYASNVTRSTECHHYHRSSVTQVGYLGPRGTFAEEALLSQPDLAAATSVPLRTVPAVLTAVERGDVELGLVPIANSIEGTVTVTLDTLAFDTELLVQREVVLPISLHLCARPGTSLDAIRTFVSHPTPFAQRRPWLIRTLPNPPLHAPN